MKVCVIHKAEDLPIENRAVPDLPSGGALIRVRAGASRSTPAATAGAAPPAGQAAAFDPAKQQGQHSKVQIAF